MVEVFYGNRDRKNDPLTNALRVQGNGQGGVAWVGGARAPVLVAVLDTGIDGEHEALVGRVVGEINFSRSQTTEDRHGHGTHVAGIIANVGDDAGSERYDSPCRFLNVKVASDKGICDAETVAKGIIWAADKGAKVINISLEIREPYPDLEEAVDYAWKQGAVLVAAAGNRGTQSPSYPAYYENCIAVAATRKDGTLSPLSNYGDWVDVKAPGFSIYSSLPGDEYGLRSGTSFAAAYVSRVAAWYFTVATDINGNGRLNDEVRAAIEAWLPQPSAPAGR